MELRLERVEGEGAHAPVWCLVLAFLAALVAGCTPVSWRVYTPQEVRAEVLALAATELSCAPKSLSIRRLRSGPRVDRLIASGCDQRVVYTCIEASLTELDCRPERLRPLSECARVEEFTPITQRDPAPENPAGSLHRKSQIKEVIHAHLDEARSCYRQGLACRPELTGRVAVKFIIVPDGHVSTAAVKSSSLDYPAVERCVVGVVRSIRFPAPRNDGIVVITYPFVFLTEE